MLLQTLEEKIADFTANSPENFVKKMDEMQIYDKPLLGVADASDILWEELKQPEIIGPHHLMPKEWLLEAKSVISYFLPFTEQIRSSNRLEGPPSQEWLYGRCEGEIFNDTLRNFIIEVIRAECGKALAPALDTRLSISNQLSNWSERHVAFVAGLGTFSLNHSMITDLGAAGRFGSVITDLEFQPTPRPYLDIDDYCNNCGICIERCPVQAITENGKDNKSCSKYLDEILELNKPRYGCGKCQTAVPCEYEKPI